MIQTTHRQTAIPLFDELDPIAFVHGWGISYELASVEIRVITSRTLAAYVASPDKSYHRKPSRRVLEFTAEAHNKRVEAGLIPKNPGAFKFRR
jgi:hypothetical protein